MLPWEADLFLKGAGCPSCQGKAPDGADFAFEHAHSLIFNGFDDYGHHDAGMEAASEQATARPVWAMPDPKLKWKCAACGVKVWEHPGDGEYYDPGVLYTTDGIKTARNQREYDYIIDDDQEPTMVGDQAFCSVCVVSCEGEGCEKKVFSWWIKEITEPMTAITWNPLPFEKSKNKPAARFDETSPMCECCWEKESEKLRLETIVMACKEEGMNDNARPDNWAEHLLDDFADTMTQNEDGDWNYPRPDGKVREVLKRWGWWEDPDYIDGTIEHEELENLREVIRDMIATGGVNENHYRYAHLLYELDENRRLGSTHLTLGRVKL